MQTKEFKDSVVHIKTYFNTQVKYKKGDLHHYIVPIDVESKFKPNDLIKHSASLADSEKVVFNGLRGAVLDFVYATAKRFIELNPAFVLRGARSNFTIELDPHHSRKGLYIEHNDFVLKHQVMNRQIDGWLSVNGVRNTNPTYANFLAGLNNLLIKYKELFGSQPTQSKKDIKTLMFSMNDLLVQYQNDKINNTQDLKDQLMRVINEELGND